MGFGSRGLSAAQVQAEVDTAIAKVMTNTTNKITDARALNLDDLDAAITSINPLNYPVFKWSAVDGAGNWKAIQGTWANGAAASMWTGSRLHNASTKALNDEVAFGSLYIPRTDDYTVYLLYQRDSVNGIAHALLSGVDKGTLDMYGATAANTVGTIAMASLAAGQYALTLKMASKNGSASNYQLDLQHILVALTP